MAIRMDIRLGWRIGACAAGVLLLVGLYFACFPRWEYRTLKMFPEEQRDRTEKEAFAFTTIKVEAELLNQLGSQGWELVSSFLEPETAFPNFGRTEYVTGLQPNVRPQAAVLLFKRRVYPWRR